MEKIELDAFNYIAISLVTQICVLFRRQVFRACQFYSRTQLRILLLVGIQNKWVDLKLSR